MRRKILLVLVIILCTTICGCDFSNNDTSEWKTIKLESLGTFEIPNNWEQKEKNGLIYFSNSNSEGINEIYLFQSNSVAFDKEKGNKETNIISDNFIGLEYVGNEGLSNGVSISTEKVAINGISQQLKLISFSSQNYDDSITYDFYVWDNSIDESTIYRIAKSFNDE